MDISMDIHIHGNPGDLWATKSNVGLIDRAISFKDFPPMWS